MKSPIPHLLLLAAFSFACPAAANEASDSPFYRVEVIVFTHSGGQSDDWPEDKLADHSASTDPAWRAFAERQDSARAEEEHGRDAADLAEALDVVEAIASLEQGESSLTELLLYPDPWLALPDLSEPMERVRTRLASSGSHRVEAWLAWHQPLDRTSSRKIRIHDDRVVAADWIQLSPLGRLRRDGREVDSIEALFPAIHYRLDGTLRLRQRQFMHADVDLHWRERAAAAPSFFPGHAASDSFRTHRLEQSRTIRGERLEYFDSPWLGLIVRLTPVEPEGAEPDPNPDAAPVP